MTEIVEVYKNYTPHKAVYKSVRRVVAGVDQKRLVGLHSIILTNSESLNHGRRRKKIPFKNRKLSLKNCNGWYQQKWKQKPAHIEILVDNLLSEWPNFFVHSSFLMDLVLSKTLYHEIGHHIHKVQAPEFNDCEDVAEKWMLKLSKKFFWKRYWYIMVPLYPVRNLIRWIVKVCEKRIKN
jgi:hypothetical protein